MSILNTERSGFFSSARPVRGYCRDIWHIEPVPVPEQAAADPEAPMSKARDFLPSHLAPRGARLGFWLPSEERVLADEPLVA